MDHHLFVQSNFYEFSASQNWINRIKLLGLGFKIVLCIYDR